MRRKRRGWANAIATGGAPVALILAFGPQSGAHMNPVVTFAAALTEGLRRHALPAYLAARILAAVLGVWLAHIWGCRVHREPVTAFAVGAYIAGAYWFTASTSFANPAVTIARAPTDTFAGIRPVDAPGFIIAQMIGLALALTLRRRTPTATTAQPSRSCAGAG